MLSINLHIFTHCSCNIQILARSLVSRDIKSVQCHLCFFGSDSVITVLINLVRKWVRQKVRIRKADMVAFDMVELGKIEKRNKG